MLTKQIIMLFTTIMLIGVATSGCDMFGGKSNAQKSLDKLQAKLIKEEKLKDKNADITAHSNYTYSQKNIFVDDKKNELAQIQKKVNLIADKLDNSDISEKSEANEKLNALLDELEMTIINIEELQNANESEWEAAKTSFRNADRKLKDSFKKTSEWLGKRLEVQ